MNTNGAQKLCAWSGIVSIGLFLIAFGPLAHFIPPPSPNDTGKQIAAVFQHNTFGIRTGLVLTMIAGALITPLTVAISVQMKRSEGALATLSYLQMCLGVMLALEIIFPSFVLQAAAFRPHRSPEVTQAIDDIAWLPFIGLYSTYVLQCGTIAIFIFKDKLGIFPRWVAYMNLWVATMGFPLSLMYYFKTGPFAWDGLFVWWLALAFFGAWMVLMPVAILQAIRRDERIPAHARPAFSAPAPALTRG
jgi:hypothetical protein